MPDNITPTKKSEDEVAAKKKPEDEIAPSQQEIALPKETKLEKVLDKLGPLGKLLNNFEQKYPVAAASLKWGAMCAGSLLILGGPIAAMGGLMLGLLVGIPAGKKAQKDQHQEAMKHPAFKQLSEQLAKERTENQENKDRMSKIGKALQERKQKEEKTGRDEPNPENEEDPAQKEGVELALDDGKLTPLTNQEVKKTAENLGNALESDHSSEEEVEFTHKNAANAASHKNSAQSR